MNSENITPFLKVDSVYKDFQTEDHTIRVLNGIDLEVQKGESLCIMGGSGAGKSTLLHLLGALDKPTYGDIFFKGESYKNMSDFHAAQFRNQNIGFVFQFHNLLKEFTAMDNVALSARIAGMSWRQSREKAKSLLVELGLEHRLKHFPNQMSGGEQQRVAVARALICEPDLLLADEPTGNLDSQNERVVQDLFFQLKAKYGLTLIAVTHNPEFAKGFERCYAMKDGQWD